MILIITRDNVKKAKNLSEIIIHMIHEQVKMNTKLLV